MPLTEGGLEAWNTYGHRVDRRDALISEQGDLSFCFDEEVSIVSATSSNPKREGGSIVEP